MPLEGHRVERALLTESASGLGRGKMIYFNNDSIYMICVVDDMIHSHYWFYLNDPIH